MPNNRQLKMAVIHANKISQDIKKEADKISRELSATTQLLIAIIKHYGGKVSLNESELKAVINGDYFNFHLDEKTFEITLTAHKKPVTPEQPKEVQNGQNGIR